MSDERNGGAASDRSWIDKIALLFSSEPRNRNDLEDVIAIAAENELIDQDARSIIEGAMQVSDMQARDIMIPRSQVVMVSRDAPAEETLKLVTETAHSRFPVIDDDRDDVIVFN